MRVQLIAAKTEELFKVAPYDRSLIVQLWQDVRNLNNYYGITGYPIVSPIATLIGLIDGKPDKCTKKACGAALNACRIALEDYFRKEMLDAMQEALDQLDSPSNLYVGSTFKAKGLLATNTAFRKAVLKGRAPVAPRHAARVIELSDAVAGVYEDVKKFISMTESSK